MASNLEWGTVMPRTKIKSMQKPIRALRLRDTGDVYWPIEPRRGTGYMEPAPEDIAKSFTTRGETAASAESAA